MIDQGEPDARSGGVREIPDGGELAQIFADLQCVTFCDAVGESAAGSSLDAALERLSTQGGVIQRLAADFDEEQARAALSEQAAGPVTGWLAGVVEREGSLAAMLQRRAGLFAEAVARRRTSRSITFEEPLVSDDACVLAAATVLVASAGGPIMLAAALYGASQAC